MQIVSPEMWGRAVSYKCSGVQADPAASIIRLPGNVDTRLPDYTASHRRIRPS